MIIGLTELKKFMLKNTLKLITTSVCLMSAIALTPAIADTCQPLAEVSTGATEITKKVDLIAVRNNFNTDFAIPGETKFRTFQATMTVENAGEYHVVINLKYPNTADSTAYDRKITMTPGETYTLDFQSPIEAQPYQVNFNISGANNNTYTISVAGCP